jgi:hypothetical protein
MPVLSTRASGNEMSIPAIWPLRWVAMRSLSTVPMSVVVPPTSMPISRGQP